MTTKHIQRKGKFGLQFYGKKPDDWQEYLNRAAKDNCETYEQWKARQPAQPAQHSPLPWRACFVPEIAHRKAQSTPNTTMKTSGMAL